MFVGDFLGRPLLRLGWGVGAQKLLREVLLRLHICGGEEITRFGSNEGRGGEHFRSRFCLCLPRGKPGGLGEETLAFVFRTNNESACIGKRGV